MNKEKSYTVIYDNDDWRDKEVEAAILKLNEGLDYNEFDPGALSMPEVTSPFEKDMLKPVTDYRKRKFYPAATGFIELLDKYPDEGMLYYYLALTFQYMTGGEEYSLRFYEKALSLLDYEEIWIDYAVITARVGEVARAIDILEDVRKKFPNDGTASMVLTHYYLDKDKRDTAISESTGKKCIKYNDLIHEWETDNQFLKPITEDYI